MRAEGQVQREWGAWAGVLLLAAALRLTGLGGLPLATSEADRALAAHSLVMGTPPQAWDEPALQVLTTGAFFLFGVSDATARLVPALAGVFAVALIGLFRPQWGRWPALGAAALLAVSPGMVAYSRWVGPESLVAALLLALLWCISRLSHLPTSWTLPGVAALLALLVHSGSIGVSALLALGAAAAARWAWGGCELPAALGEALRQDRHRIAEAASAFLLPFTLIGSGLLLYPEGFGVPSLLAWLKEFEEERAAPGAFAWIKLAVYDPAAVGLGVLGAALLLSRGGREGPSARLLWTAAGLLAVALLPDADGGALLVALLPLTLLGGALAGSAWSGMDARAWRRLALVAPLALALAGLLLLNGLRRSSAPTGEGSVEALLLLGALGLLVALALWPQEGGPPLPYPAAALLLAAGLLAANTHSLTHLNFVPGPTEWFGESRPDAGTLALLRASGLRHPAAAPAFRDASSLAVEQLLPSPVRWYLRDQAGVSYVSAAPEGPAFVLAASESAFPGRSRYIARSLPLETRWRPDQISLPGLWRWFWWREPYGAAPVQRRVTLYQRS